MKYIYYSIIMLLTLCSCTKSAPDAYVIKAGMTREEVAEALKKINIDVDADTDSEYYDDDDETTSDGRPTHLRINEDIEYLGVTWTKTTIDFNKQGLVDGVSFTFTGDLDKSALADALSKELGEKYNVGSYFCWSVKDKWLVMLSDSNPPVPNGLTYWYKEYIDHDSSKGAEEIYSTDSDSD